ncbi:MAG: xynZ 1 [Mucilaginibacter sp.]|nr:xynZ 1 [Mucilaginibacter sp.]
MTLIKRIFTPLLLLFVLSFFKVNAASVDTVLTHSTVMNKDMKVVVVQPANYSTDKKFPVLYLLHGYSGNYSDWILKVPSITKLADKYDMIIVCPDGGFASWYFDSPMNKQSQYETYFSKELVSYIDGHYSTISDRTGRAITGLSMGGHGALYLAFKHQDIYGAAGSMSGAVDLRPFPDNFGIKQVLGTYKEHPDLWEKNSIINMVYILKPSALAIIFDDGADDLFFAVNNALHQKLLDKKIPHDFTSRPGAHTWEYWENSINYQALFFSRFFNKEK